MAGQKVAKITISLPRPLLEVADRMAQEQSMSRSRFIAHLLEKEEESGLLAQMEEGYREMAEKSRQFGEETFGVVSEMLERTTEWDDVADD